MDEGSTEVDNGVMPVVSQDESQDEIETRDDGDQSEGEETQTQEGEVGEDGKPVVKTEKGTNLDPNPLSQAHQLLANERRIRENYERVLGDPELLRKYAQENGITLAEAKAEIKEEKKALTFTPDRFKSAEDVANALNEMYGNFEKTTKQIQEENRSLREQLSGISNSRQVERVASSMQSDIGSLQEKYPQLNPKSPEYDKDLENEIGSFYHDLDAVDRNDPSKGYRGQISIADVAERFMRVRGDGMKRGSQRAQTEVVVKQSGKVVTSSKSTSKDAQSSSDPGTSIAQKIAKTLSNK